jgi:hypothetical protein
VGGMTCAMCAQAVETALRAVSGRPRGERQGAGRLRVVGSGGASECSVGGAEALLLRVGLQLAGGRGLQKPGVASTKLGLGLRWAKGAHRGRAA